MQATEMPQDLFAQALQLHQQGHLDQARALYAALLAELPGHAQAMHMLGALALQTGDARLAIRWINASIDIDAFNPASHLNLGLAWQAQGQWPRALACFDEALRLQPDYAQGLLHRGGALHACQRLDEALQCYQRVLQLHPDFAEAWYNQGLALAALGRTAQAQASYARAIALRPGYAPALNNCGVILEAQQQLDEAAHHYGLAIASQPDFAPAHYNLGNVRRTQQRWQEALAAYDTCLALQADNAQAWLNRALALQALGLRAQALECYDRAITIDPHYADAYWNKALDLLAAGDFAQGWPLYEWRWQRANFSAQRRSFSQPLWLGQADVDGKTVLLHAEQGLGDTLQFCRFVPLVRALGAQVWLEVPRSLISVCQGLEGVHRVIEKTPNPPLTDLHCPLLSLPLALRIRQDQLPERVPYLRSSQAQREVWRQTLGPTTLPRIGVVWSGNPADRHDAQRSLRLEQWLPYLPPGLDYLCLQKALRQEDCMALAQSGIRFVGDAIGDFSDTAALCDLVDLVVSVDTSVAHLAGAMGRPTWILLPHDADWRWMYEREDSPWYPSVRLYRQGPARAWPAVLQRVAEDLQSRYPSC